MKILSPLRRLDALPPATRQFTQLALLLVAFLFSFTWDRGIELWLALATLLTLTLALALSDERRLILRAENAYGRYALSALVLLSALCVVRAATSDILAHSLLLAAFYLLPLVVALICLQMDRARLLRMLAIAALVFYPLLLAGSALHLIVITNFGYNRFKWPFDDANHLAMVFNTGIAVSIGLILHQKTRRFGAFLLPVVFSGLLLSGSRAGFIACAMMGIAALLLRPREVLPLLFSRKHIGGITLALAGVIAGAYLIGIGASLPFAPLTEIITNPARASGSRPDFWMDTLRLILERPVWGYGTGTFSFVFARAIEPDHLTSALAAHNDFLQIWLETGVIGALLYLALAGFVVTGTMKYARAITDTGGRAAFIAATLALLSLGFQAQIEFMLPVLPLLILFGVALAVWVHTLPANTQAAQTKSPALYGQLAGAALISLMLLSCVFIRADLLIRQGDNALARHDLKTFAQKMDDARRWSFDLHAFPYIRAANYNLAMLASGNPGDATSADDIAKLLADARARNPYLSSLYEAQGRLDQLTGKSPVPAWETGLRLEPRNAGIRIALIRYYERLGMGAERDALLRETARWRYFKGPTTELRALLEKHRDVLTCDGVCP